MVLINKQKILICCVLTLVPIFALVSYCLYYNQDIIYYFLPNSKWNDELIYYKTIESMIEYGLPQGYYGYNESCAHFGTFSAWSPTIYIIDYLIALIFGWNYYTPIIARIIISCLAFLIFALLCNPNIKTSLFILFFFSFYNLFARYTASHMSDAYIIDFFIIFFSLWHFLNNQYNRLFTHLLLTIIFFLTLMRPYYAVLWLAFFTFEKNKYRIIASGAVSTIGICFYFIMSKYCTAPYFTNLIQLDWIREILSNPFYGIKNLLIILCESFHTILIYIYQSLFQGADVGFNYLLLFTMMFLLILFAYKYKTLRKHAFILLIMSLSILISIILFYNVYTGARHLIPFIIIDGLFLFTIELNIKKKLLILTITCYMFFIFSDTYVIDFPRYDKNFDNSLIEMGNTLEHEIEIDTSNRWNNTIIWILYDTDGAYPFQTLFAIPSGLGINICTDNYVKENIKSLNSKYVACTVGGDCLLFLESNGFVPIYIDENLNACILKR